jgi:hypothetical protein
VTSSLGRHTYVESKSLARFCCELLNLQHLAESAFFEIASSIEAQTRQVLHPLVSFQSFPGSDLEESDPNVHKPANNPSLRSEGPISST